MPAVPIAIDPDVSSAKPHEDATAAILAAVRRAPPVPAEEREAMRALLAEVKSDPRAWRTSAEFLAVLGTLPRDDSDDDGE
jgi:hypothetical protein